MGECLTPVPVKLRAETVAGIDGMRAQLPLEPGRSTVARGLIEEVFLLIAEGILQFRVATGKRLLSVSSNSQTQSIPGIPEQFPSVETSEQMLGPKPPRRVAPSPRDASRRAINGVSRRSYAEVQWAYNPPFISKIGPLKFNRRAA